MTSEQIEIVNNIKFSIIKAIDNIESEQMWEMIEKAYEQKEKDHCEDCISREAVINELKLGYFNKDLKEGKNDPCVIDAMIDWAIRTAKRLPSVTPQQKMGRWIKHDTGHSIYYDCSLCGCVAPCTETADKILWKMANYCPDCGAKMEVEE